MKKRLSDILYKCPVREIKGTVEQPVTSVVFDSRRLEEGSLFVAVKGTQYDGHDFIGQAIDAGAGTIVCEKMPETRLEHITYVKVENAAQSLGLMACNYYDNPSHKLSIVGVTGTNGKTTIATLLHRLFTNSGFKAGLISTIENRIGDAIAPATHTTPDPVALNKLIAEMLDAGCTYVFMEVSSHALDQQRVSGLLFTGGIFTNLTHDHLDYHQTFAAYRNAKKSFFDMLPSQSFALTNLDDRNGRYMVQNCKAGIRTFGLQHDADFKGKLIENLFEGLVLEIDKQQVYTKLTGQFNASNLMAIYGASCLLGMDPQTAMTGLSLLESAEGRFDYMRAANGTVGIVDYAHTPDALENVLKTIDEIRTRNEKLITVVGAGGNRDRSKRPKMAAVAAEYSDKLILTSDNPRNENPEDIINEMRTGVPAQHFKKTLAISDRREAIRTAIALAQAGDIILVAGKGHEKYQEIKGVKHPFDDKQELFNLLET